MLIPIIDQHGLNQNFVFSDVGIVSPIFDDPIREEDTRLVKICCPKARTARLLVGSVVPGTTPGIIWSVSVWVLCEPIVSDLSEFGFSEWLTHTTTSCRAG